MITLTPAAARQIQDAQDQEGNEELALRIAARRGADGEVEYAMGLDEEREEDYAFVEKGVNLLVGAPSKELLEGVVLDFVEYEPGDFRFIFIPPEAEQGDAPAPSCGSGGCSRCGGA